MSAIEFSFDWIDPGNAEGPELRATWACFSIFINKKCATRVFQQNNKSIRDKVFAPLYPVAEWAASNWWFLHHEVANKCRPSSATYDMRHTLRFAGDGFCYPDITIIPTGKDFIVEWKERICENSRLEFLGNDIHMVQKKDVTDFLRQLIEITIGRLDDQGISDTFLHEEWEAISTADKEEKNFCAIVAEIGEDPYNIHGEDAAKIISISKNIPFSIAADFFQSSTLATLDGDFQLIEYARRDIESDTNEFPELAKLRGIVKAENTTRPWTAGYEVAGKLREYLRINGTQFHSITDILHSFSSRLNITNSIITKQTSSHLFDAVVGLNKCDSPIFMLNKNNDKSERFSFCRALYEHITGNGNTLSMVTSSYSYRQKRNRAFAAEFLAPAKAIQERIGRTPRISSEAVDEIAEEFGVYSSVIRHQIENHEIAYLI